MNFKMLPVAAAGLLLATAVSAQQKAPEPDSTFAFNVGAVTDYRYRGISQSRLLPAAQGGVDFSHKSGFYLGAWASTIRWLKDIPGGDGPLELDLYGGYKGEMAKGVTYDVGLLRYQYPKENFAVSVNTTELYGAVTYGPVTGKYSHSLTNLFGFGASKGSGYFDVSATFDVGGVSVVPHIGYQKVAGAANSPLSYTDYSVTVSKDFSGVVVSAALVGTDANKTLYVTPAGKFTGKAGLVLGVKYNF